MPDYRRRGLARWVANERLKAAAKSGIRGFCFVYVGNEVSQRMWEDLGWTRGWQVEWVYTRNEVG